MNTNQSTKQPHKTTISPKPTEKIFALIDCNNFFVSCERAFNPKLRDRPVIVLSNNDGCAVARSDEAKKAGVPMAAPAFKIENLIRQHDIQVLSSNYPLYADMSQRVMNTIAQFTPEVEVYSIDEAFISLENIAHRDLTKYAARIQNTVNRWTGIPISIGIAPTKTLAKAANSIAKKYPNMNGLCNLCENPMEDELLTRLPINKVWGVGHRYAEKLRRENINTAHDLKKTDPKWVKKRMTISGWQTHAELNGLSCIDLQNSPVAPKTIVTSRSFGRPVTRYEDMQQAVASFTSRTAEKLREKKSLASTVHVYIMTNRHKRNERQYSQIGTATTTPATDYTPDLVKLADTALKGIFIKGYRYKKAHVMLSGIQAKKDMQFGIFESPQSETNYKNGQISLSVDQINQEWGRGTIKTLAEGVYRGPPESASRDWKMRQNYVSPRYTTSWCELLEVAV